MTYNFKFSSEKLESVNEWIDTVESKTKLEIGDKILIDYDCFRINLFKYDYSCVKDVIDELNSTVTEKDVTGNALLGYLGMHYFYISDMYYANDCGELYAIATLSKENYKQ